ncbi:serine hydrolase [Streptosporangium lutulentum]
MTTVHGTCDPRFSRVREVFDRHFADGEELGAAFAVFLDGEPVVDLWGGIADRHTGRAWESDTPVLVYSCTKAVTATAASLLAERGLLDVTAPVADVWPEFARGGKERVTVEHLLTHRSGLPVIEEQVPPEEFEDQVAMADRLAGQTPIWEPGTAHGYHALTYGFLVGEVIRRVSGKTVGEIVATEIAGPLGLDLWVGAPDDVAARAARLSAGTQRKPETGGRPDDASTAAELPGQGPGDPVYEMARASLDKNSLMNRALGNPPIHKLQGAPTTRSSSARAGRRWAPSPPPGVSRASIATWWPGGSCARRPWTTRRAGGSAGRTGCCSSTAPSASATCARP